MVASIGLWAMHKGKLKLFQKAKRFQTRPDGYSMHAKQSNLETHTNDPQYWQSTRASEESLLAGRYNRRR